MISIDEQYVESTAPNSDAVKNGRGLVVKGRFLALHIDAKESILFGECQGSGKVPYLCSSDFARPDQPTHRCSCPSRQFPCKHCVGLMFAYVLKRPSFITAEVPASLAEKREKLATRVETKRQVTAKPKTVNKTVLAKKIRAQLDGMDLLEKLTFDLTRIGIGNTNAKIAREIEENAKQLGNAYLPGAQAALYRYTKLFGGKNGAFDPNASTCYGESMFTEAMDQLSRLHSIVKQGRAYLRRRLDDPDLKPEVETAIAAWLGHAWQLAELKAAGLVQTSVELLQLAFNSHDDTARQEFVDTGLWLNISTGRIHVTQNFRPYKAVKYIKSDDSFFQVAQVNELCIYPGDVNPRIRWEGMIPRPVEPRDLQLARELARDDFGAVIKEVKTNLKAPLADKQPVYALRFRRIGQVEGVLVVEDSRGERLVMTDAGMTEEPASCHLLQLLSPALHENQTMVVRFRHDLDRRKLDVKPLSIVTLNGIVRLTL
jgi:SWIM zinc finger